VQASEEKKPHDHERPSRRLRYCGDLNLHNSRCQSKYFGTRKEHAGVYGAGTIVKALTGLFALHWRQRLQGQVKGELGEFRDWCEVIDWLRWQQGYSRRQDAFAGLLLIFGFGFCFEQSPGMVSRMLYR
jgi:hypothetical protein